MKFSILWGGVYPDLEIVVYPGNLVRIPYLSLQTKFKDLSVSHVKIVVYPGILVPRKYLSWQKIFGKMLTINCKIDYNVS